MPNTSATPAVRRNKAYSPALGKKHDANGKRLAVEIMRDLAGATLIEENTSEQAGDFSKGFWDQRYKLVNGTEVIVEPEMKDAKWWGEHFHAQRPFQYADVDIPYRKHKNKASIHLVISTDERYAFIVTRRAMDEHLAITGGQPKVKVTRWEPEGASYFSTPVDKGFFVKRGEDGRWRRWKRS